MSCPCGKGPSLDECCGPIVRGERLADTAEALMRARYTAYTLAEKFNAAIFAVTALPASNN